MNAQDFIPIESFEGGLIHLKNGDTVMLLQTNAVNFGLLSEGEQQAIIGSFAGFLNSLSFPIQVVIRSRRLNIASYLSLLDQARSKQKNPLLSQMILRYRNFVERTIKENEVLDKMFFVAIPLYSIELGLITNKVERQKKALSFLYPRRDHVLRQLAGFGLQARQLNEQELVKTFYDIYNGIPTPEVVAAQPTQATVAANQIAAAKVTTAAPTQPVVITPAAPPVIEPAPREKTPPPLFENQPIREVKFNEGAKPLHVKTPFVVEELRDDHAAI